MKASHPRKTERRPRVSAEKLTPERALQNLEAFARELDAGWKRDGLEWALDLLVLLRAFTTEARKKSPDRERLALALTAIREYLGRYRFLKGIDYVLVWAEVVIARPANRSKSRHG